jgi:aminoglycoside phosphotransferase (APT) family kinase protein
VNPAARPREEALQEHNQLDSKQVAQIIRAQFPGVSPDNVSYLGQGCDSLAFDVDNQWVFRFPKRADVEQQLLLEIRVLPVLAKQSPVPLPEYCFRGQPSAAFPRHFGGYAKLPGVRAIGVDPATIPLDRWARPLAQFLSWLHTFPVREAARLGVGHQEVASLIEEVRADALDDFELLNQVAPDAPLEEWCLYLTEGLQTPARSLSMPVLVHRDLAAEHVLCDPTKQTLTGIIDWSDIAVSDRSIDFAGLFHWGGRAFFDSVLARYDGPVDEATLCRARYLAVCRGVADVAFGLETGRREYIEAGIRALTLCIGGQRPSGRAG